jgi:hypothetical protein
MTAEQLAEALGARRSGRQFKCRCVAHEDSNPSMLIFDGRQSVQVRCMAGCKPRDIIAVLKSRGLWHGDEMQDETQNVSHLRVSVSREKENRDRELARMREIARGIFDEAVPIEGTLAQRYFEQRDLWSVARMVPDIRYQPHCPREQYRQPAVVVAMRSYTSNAVLAIQRIFLTRDAKKDGKPMMLGSPLGAAMQLQRLQNGALHICEGLETGLAIIAQDHGPVWALGSTALIQSFAVLDGVSELTIWADHDEKKLIGGVWCRAGEKAAVICAQRWRAADRKVRIFEPENEGDDAADEWSRRNARL